MGVAYHTLYAPDGAPVNLFDRVVLGTITVTYAAAASSGASVATTVTWGEPILGPYAVFVSPTEDSTYFVTGKAATSLTLTMAPRLVSASLTGGNVELLLIS